MRKKIAIIGSGISGLFCGKLLNKDHDIEIFESNDYVGGHTHTVDVDIEGKQYAIDTGFIVYNKKTYPHFCKFLDDYAIETQATEMSFSFYSSLTQMEYNGHSLNTLFSNRHNLINIKFYRFIWDIFRFNRDAKLFLLKNNESNKTIKCFTEEKKYSDLFVRIYLIPMIAAIWSKNPEDVWKCSALHIFKFYNNHGLLNTLFRPEWRVLRNGSRTYIEPLVRDFKDKIKLNSKIEKIIANDNFITLRRSNNEQYQFDAVVIATHSDEALNLLDHPSQHEAEILSSIRYTKNEVFLHTDTTVMPKNKRTWASWNFYDDGSGRARVTYYMNRLQNIQSSTPFLVSLNLEDKIDKTKIINKFNYSHPCIDLAANAAQKKHSLINGKNNIYYAGSYWGNGFHEDGILSAIKACQPLGVSL